MLFELDTIIILVWMISYWLFSSIFLILTIPDFLKFFTTTWSWKFTHFFCCRCSQKAIESCIQARQWSKAVQIIELQDPSIGSDYYQQIADHYHAIKDYQLAEQYYLKADMSQQAIDMYIKADQWEEAYRLAVGCMAQEDLSQLYTSRAKQLEEDGKLKGVRIVILLQYLLFLWTFWWSRAG